jgi:hypothetical protein
LSSAARAQTYYKWTDERGTVHITDQPPSGVRDVQERKLQPQPPAIIRGASEPSDATATPQTTPQAAGPARIILDGYQTTRTGPASMHVSGAVKNVGGSNAENVVVVLSAVDAGQGNPCYESEVNMDPASVGAGDRRSFELDITDPCLNGDAKLDASPRWQGSATVQ